MKTSESDKFPLGVFWNSALKIWLRIGHLLRDFGGIKVPLDGHMVQLQLIGVICIFYLVHCTWYFIWCHSGYKSSISGHSCVHFLEQLVIVPEPSVFLWCLVVLCGHTGFVTFLDFVWILFSNNGCYIHNISTSYPSSVFLEYHWLSSSWLWVCIHWLQVFFLNDWFSRSKNELRYTRAECCW